MKENKFESEKGVIRAHDVGIHFTLARHKNLTLKEAAINTAKRQSLKREFWALRGVTFEVPRGEIVGIVGRNGSGKSTLLRILAGVYQPDVGTVAVGGRIGALIDLSAGMHGDLTGEENIYLSGAIIGMGRREVKRLFESITEFSGLEDFIYQPVKFYSSGMKLRLGFSTTVHMDPDVLLIDEVIAVGDAEFKRKCYNRIQDVMKRGATVILVSHNLVEIGRFCPHTLWLDAGRLLMHGSTNQVLEAYHKRMEEERERKKR